MQYLLRYQVQRHRSVTKSSITLLCVKNIFSFRSFIIRVQRKCKNPIKREKGEFILASEREDFIKSESNAKFAKIRIANLKPIYFIFITEVPSILSKDR